MPNSYILKLIINNKYRLKNIRRQQINDGVGRARLCLNVIQH